MLTKCLTIRQVKSFGKSSHQNFAGSIPHPLVSTALVCSFRRVKTPGPRARLGINSIIITVFFDAVFPKTCLPQAPTRPNCATRSATPAGRSIRRTPHSECRRGNGARGSPCEIRRRQWEALARGIISQGSPCEIRRKQWEALAQALFHRARRTRLGDDGNQIGAHSALRTLHSALERLFS